MKERLSWEEIVKAYPDKWVGLSDVKWNGAAPDVESAVVIYSGESGGEALKRQLAGEDVYTFYTGEDNLDVCPLGFLSTVIS